jgi:hypothetical protein
MGEMHGANKEAFDAFCAHCVEEVEQARDRRIRHLLAAFIPADAHPGAIRFAEGTVRSRVIEVCLTDQKFLKKAQALYDRWEKPAVLRLIAKRERPLIARFARQVGRETFGGPTILDRFRRLFRWVSVSKVQGGM